MAEILNDYADNSGMGGNRASNGGKMEKKDLPYSPPKGPIGQMQQGPGLHGSNCGNCGTQGKR